jgi:hypothetical protein
VVNVGVRDSSHVLGSLLYPEFDLRIKEHRSYHTRTVLAVLCPITVLVHLSYDKGERAASISSIMRRLSGKRKYSHAMWLMIADGNR